MADRPGWYGVRGVFHWTGAEGTPYEERVTLWRAHSVEDALARSEIEAERYALESGVEYLGFAQAYFIGGGAVSGDGDEVFSLLRDSDLAPDDYLAAFFDTGGEHDQQSPP
jgi:hypothetical protein